MRVVWNVLDVAIKYISRLLGCEHLFGCIDLG